MRKVNALSNLEEIQLFEIFGTINHPHLTHQIKPINLPILQEYTLLPKYRWKLHNQCEKELIQEPYNIETQHKVYSNQTDQ